MTSKTLTFVHAGTTYQISLEPATLGHVIRYGQHKFSLPHPSWVIIGFTRHHWSNSPVRLTPDVKPADLKGCMVWDRDHGTTRQWSGCYAGKLPRITQAWIG